MRFNSPTVNLRIKPDDYIKLLRDLRHYMTCSLTVTRNRASPTQSVYWRILGSISHIIPPRKKQRPSGSSESLGFDTPIYSSWFTDRDGCTEQNLIDFDALPHRHKVVFTHLPHPELRSAYYIMGWEEKSCVGNCFEYSSKYTGKKHYDEFDYVTWFNNYNES